MIFNLSGIMKNVTSRSLNANDNMNVPLGDCRKLRVLIIERITVKLPSKDTKNTIIMTVIHTAYTGVVALSHFSASTALTGQSLNW